MTPLSDIDAWADYLSRVEIPVLPETASAIAALAADEDNADALVIAAPVMRDPLMCARLYRHLATLKRGSHLTDVESVTGCIVMMGVSPFFRHFADLAVAAPAPGVTSRQWQGLNAVLWRARRASDFAFDWAVRRNDLDAEIIATAALMHEFAEMLLWCVAPALAAELQDRLTQNPGLRSLDAQKAILNVGINDLQHELMLRWHLPQLLVRISDDRQAVDVQVRTVTLAVAMARHSANGWNDPALPDDYAALGALLNIAPALAQALVSEPPA